MKNLILIAVLFTLVLGIDAKLPDQTELENARIEKLYKQQQGNIDGADENQGPDYSDTGVGCVDDCLEIVEEF